MKIFIHLTRKFSNILNNIFWRKKSVNIFSNEYEKEIKAE